MLHLALAFDDRYAVHARACMESLLAADGDAGIHFWLAITGDVGTETRHHIEAQLAGRAAVTFVESALPLRSLGRSADAMASHVSEAMYLRLDLPHLVGEEVERLIYVDCDVLCTRSIAALAQCDLAGHPIGAVRDAHTHRLSDSGSLPGLVELGLNPKADYFNSGVLVIDVKAWRAKGIKERCLSYLETYRGQLRFPDQDALNVALYGDWHRLPKEYNYMLVWRLERRLGGSLSDACLVHSAGPYKHWHEGFLGTDLQQLYRFLRRRADAHLVAA